MSQNCPTKTQRRRLHVMSADNGIYILPSEKGSVYRVGYAHAIDNIDYFIKRGMKRKLIKTVEAIWSPSPVFRNKKRAWDYAKKLELRLPALEYGIQEIKPIPGIKRIRRLQG